MQYLPLKTMMEGESSSRSLKKSMAVKHPLGSPVKGMWRSKLPIPCTIFLLAKLSVTPTTYGKHQENTCFNVTRLYRKANSKTKVYPRKEKTEGERSDFIWFDGKRREESAPEGIVAKRQKNRETRRAWAWKSVSPPEQCPVEEDKTEEGKPEEGKTEEGKTEEDKTEENIIEKEIVEEDTTAEDKHAWGVWCRGMEKKYLDPWHQELSKQGVIVYPSRNAF